MARRYNLRRSTRSRRLRHHRPTGAPQDPTPRLQLDMEDLDLDKSYSKLNRSDSSHRPEKQRQWQKWDEKEPLTDPAKLPKGWHMNEPDLATDDIESQIKRCHERIAENIMPHIFQQRLKEYEAAKTDREQKRSSEDEGLDDEVKDRLHYLELVLKDLEEKSVKHKQIPNIKAIMEAYRQRQLDWDGMLVTYWSNGDQLCQPRPFDWDEFETINKAHNGKEGFWTEGVRLHSAQGNYASTIMGPRTPSHHTPMKIALRAPGQAWFAELDYLHDTGSSCMSIYEEDFVHIVHPNEAPYLPVVCEQRVGDSHGNFQTTLIVELEATILDANRHRMTAWTRVPCGVNPGRFSPTGVPRLDGPWVRDLLYVGGAPDGQGLMCLANRLVDLKLPDLDLVKNPPLTLAQGRYKDPNVSKQVAGPYPILRPRGYFYKKWNWMPMPPAAPGAPS
ncbi:uncharacterized protein N7511_005351 [Penicillium nucicola]|uniref:uncharacterized protein n=1 Tax=Penicillium nucicola TaxID=1850975 RepID=UPI002545B4E0|nr:uncharacterized protein N7511_005351 [Penicillium nucicola]KAJ5761969.1 hypothetical protein N7511_005351 [Penicillium nucicola]